jgi:dienelactone hydrolase
MRRACRGGDDVRKALPLLLAGLASTGWSQSTPASLNAALAAPIHSPEVVNYQLRQYIRRLVKEAAVPASATQWDARASALRRKVLSEVVFHGWPPEWVNRPAPVEDLGLIPTSGAYRLRKLRYQVVPGFQTTALVYEPLSISGKAPGILNTNGHEPAGKAEEYIQKRCINQALQGIVAVNPEWIFTGELNQPENAHWYGAHIDLAGANSLGVFYLAMRRALDYLYDRPDVDRSRIGITGLSGGGWQSIVLGALDERISVAVPVAGYLPSISFAAGEHAGDNEQTATDFSAVADYPVLTAMRAPRPTLLIYNAEDNCCFRAPRMKPDLFYGVRPFFGLYGKEGQFEWHENLDPGTHNYQVENRLLSYRFFARYFGLSPDLEEVPAGGLIKSAKELTVGLPEDNLTLVGIARKLAERIERPPLADLREERKRLAQVVLYQRRELDRAWIVANSKSREVESRSYRFDFKDGLTATGVWLKAIAVPDEAPATIVLNDTGAKASGVAVSERLNRGEQVVALDLLFTGGAAPPPFGYPDHDRMLASLGERSLGIRVAQLRTVSAWLAAQTKGGKIRVETAGMRTQVAALIAVALDPTQYSEIVVSGGIGSLAYLLGKPVRYEVAPELFCLDLFRYFDVDRLRAIAQPVKVTDQR